MRSAIVYQNGRPAGRLTEESPGGPYLFRYDDAWFLDTSKPAVSLTLPKTQQEYRNTSLFPFFFHLLSEGSNREVQTRTWHLDEQDHFGLLLATAHTETSGSVTIRPQI